MLAGTQKGGSQAALGSSGSALQSAGQYRSDVTMEIAEVGRHLHQRVAARPELDAEPAVPAPAHGTLDQAERIVLDLHLAAAPGMKSAMKFKRHAVARNIHHARVDLLVDVVHLAVDAAATALRLAQIGIRNRLHGPVAPR